VGAGPSPAVPSSRDPPPAGPSRHRPVRSAGPGFWVGVGLLSLYLAAALSALYVFRGSLSQLSENLRWAPIPAMGPSWAHPFGIMPAFGTDLFRALWQATPWDLGIVAGILSIDVTLGFLLGGWAGLTEGGLPDVMITFVGDSLGSIPPFILAVVLFAGVSTLRPGELSLPLFVVLFGLILWPTMGRTVRERARLVAHEPYVEAARASGATSRHLLVRHILPNSVGPVLAQVPLDVAPIFLVLSAFPWFYTCGGVSWYPPPDFVIPHLPAFSPLPSVQFPEWGFLLGVGTCVGFTIPGGFSSWWTYLFPLLAIVGLGVAIGLFCDGIERIRRFER
jgi:ABC-type dipeptide/oligopeptide/nickel transport system permease subunit